MNALGEHHPRPRGMRRPPVVRILEHDPDLAPDLREEDFQEACDASLAQVGFLERGPWNPVPEQFRPANLGLLVLDGLLARRVTLGHRTCAEVLGPGDILRPWVTTRHEDSIRSDVNWVVVQRARIAMLDRNFIARVARWPEVIAGIGNRSMLRAHWLAFHLAVCHMRRVDERLLVVLWHFADRWGRVRPDGVVIELPFTHRLLASIIGAQRPSVSTALTQLASRGAIERLPDRSWLLRGDPPVRIGELYEPPADLDERVAAELADSSD